MSTIPIERDAVLMTRTVDLCPSPHLSSDDLRGPDGEFFELDLTIRQFEKHQVGPEKEMKGVLYFAERNRGLVVNRTNVKMLVRLHGNDLNSLVGKRITLYVNPDVQLPGGGTGPGLRIRDRVPAEKTVPADKSGAKQSAQKQTA
jgi:hypothetical protein